MKKLCSLCLLLVLMLALASCGDEKTAKETDFKIVTSFYPVYITTLNITDGAEGVHIENFTKPDYGCMHDYILTTDNVKGLSEVDLFIASGMGMETFVEKSVLGIHGLEVLDSGEDVPFVLTEKTKKNSHYWMNIENTINQTEKIARTLIRLNPENSAVYEKNAEEYKAKLKSLLEDAREKMGDEADEMVIFHEGIDYFADQFGIRTINLFSGHDVDTATEKRIKETIDYMTENNITVVYAEKGAKKSVALKTLEKATNCTVRELDLVASGKLSADVKDAYINAVRENLDVIFNETDN